jgi:hypothetical protein
MAVTLDELEQRLMRLEEEVSRLRRLVAGSSPDETPPERTVRRLHEAEADQSALTAGWAKAMEAMGIHGKPIGARRLQAMIAASGIRPEDNEFSRALIEAREE